jgi:hypothetical protein
MGAAYRACHGFVAILPGIRRDVSPSSRHRPGIPLPGAEITEMTKTYRRLITSCAALLLAAGLGGCAVYEDGYGPGYAGGGGYYGGGYGGGYYGGSTAYYGGGGYRPRTYRDNDRYEHRPAHYQHQDHDRGGNSGGHRDNRWEGRRDSGRDHNRQAYNGN